HTPPTATHTPSLHDALPISAHYAAVDRQSSDLSPDRAQLRLRRKHPLDGALEQRAVGLDSRPPHRAAFGAVEHPVVDGGRVGGADRKSTRLNSSHVKISYAV